MRIAMLGATRGCGLEALVSLLQQSETPVEIVTLARNREAFSKTLEDRLQGNKKPFNKIEIIQGDALKLESISSFFDQIMREGPIDHVVSSIGALPDYNIKQPLTIKFAPGMENVCSRAMWNTLTALEDVVISKQPNAKATKLYVISSNGIGKSTHDALPLILRPLFSRFLKHPHDDKHDMEAMLHKRYNIHSADFNDFEASSSQVQDSAFDRNDLTILRPSLLTDGKATNSIRSSDTTLKGAWTISRKDVGNFIAKRILSNEQSGAEEWQGGIVLSN